ncbi:membrane protein [Lactococcus garvieae]|nr:membrane protein [Lactococcus garvieae]
MTRKLLLLNFIGFVISISIYLFEIYFSDSIVSIQSILPSEFYPFLEKGIEYLNFGITILTFAILVLIGVELVNRISNDSAQNYFRSVWRTHTLRRFLIQSERKELSEGNQKSTSINPILQNFNRSVQKEVVDIRRDKISVLLYVPNSGQAQKILYDMEAQIIKEVSSYNLDYYFSKPYRVKNRIWIIGTRR